MSDCVHRDRGAPGAAPRGRQAGRRSTAASASPRRRAAASKTTDLWLEIGKNGYLGINIPEEYGGGGGGIGDIAAVCEELAAQGCPLLLMVVSARRSAAPSSAATAPRSRSSAGCRASATAPGRWRSRSPSPTPAPTPTTSPPPRAATATAGCSTGRKIYISGVDEADERARRRPHRGRPDRQAQARACSWCRPTPRASSSRPIPMEIVSPEQQFQVFIDDVRLPADALVGDEDGGLVQLFAGLNPERIMAASFSTGLARFALEQGDGVRQGAHGLRGARSAPTRPSRTRWRSPRSRSSWPG